MGQAAAMLVPKAAVYEYCQPPSGEHEVRPSGQSFPMKSVP